MQGDPVKRWLYTTVYALTLTLIIVFLFWLVAAWLARQWWRSSWDDT